MDEVHDAAGIRRIVSQQKRQGKAVGLVPTMGYLHAGHLRLIEEARRQSDLVIMSSYVNPTQFGPHEDLDRYPRDENRDRTMAAEAGVDVLFAPHDEVMYPHGAGEQQIWVVPEELDRVLCGASRPGHFRGVCTVVAKLFNLVQPDFAFFGQKDAQQAAIIVRMVEDLAFPVTCIIVPTVREEDGLALSSRNVYLNPEERRQAPALHEALLEARRAIESGERTPSTLESMTREYLETHASLGRVDYVTLVDQRTLQPLQDPIAHDALLALAVYFGKTRLIDNLQIRMQEGFPPFS